MGWIFRLWSSMTRPFRNYNIRQRAHKVMETKKAAPRHRVTQDNLDEVRQRFPEMNRELHTKNDGLLAKLKDVYVSSSDPVQLTTTPPTDEQQADISTTTATRALPTNRRWSEEAEHGTTEPVRIPHGRFSLRQALIFISEHQADPGTHTAGAIASRYHLQPTDAANVLRHFATFRLHTQNAREDDSSGHFRPDVRRLYAPNTRPLLDNTAAGEEGATVAKKPIATIAADASAAKKEAAKLAD